MINHLGLRRPWPPSTSPSSLPTRRASSCWRTHSSCQPHTPYGLVAALHTPLMVAARQTPLMLQYCSCPRHTHPSCLSSCYCHQLCSTVTALDLSIMLYAVYIHILCCNLFPCMLLQRAQYCIICSKIVKSACRLVPVNESLFRKVLHAVHIRCCNM